MEYSGRVTRSSASSTFSNQKFLIIAGTSKAGTTSVFNYLADHPEIWATEVKETRFFLDMGYPLPSKRRYEKDGASVYSSFFPDVAGRCEEDWKLEATPDYLYSPKAAQWIRDTLPNVRLIFLLREPVSRLVSFYQFGKQIDEIPQRLDFDQYVDLQKTATTVGSSYNVRHPAYSALPHGRYSNYLDGFLELFGRSAVHVAFYEDLRRDPHETMIALCRWVGIDENYFDTFAFGVTNKGVKMRNPRINRIYSDARRRARQVARKHPTLRSVLRQVGGRVNAVYRRLNVASRDEVIMSDSTENFLREYYLEEPARLKQMLEIGIPWSEE